MAVHQVEQLDQYLQYLQETPAELDALFRDLLIGVTNFFRDKEVFEALQQQLALVLAAKPADSPLRVWTAGCSTGEEPYSIAMTLADTLHASNYHIVASDLDTQVLATARHAVYPLASVLKLPESRQKRFFLRGTGRNDGRARVRPEIASHVEFARVNLMDAEWGVEPPFDAIFCRNVMIYFDKPTQRRLIERYARMLSPGGLFFAGHAESLLDQGRVFKLRGQTVYELAR